MLTVISVENSFSSLCTDFKNYQVRSDFMKFLALGDTHLGLLVGRNASAKKELATYCQQQFRKVINRAIDLNVDAVLHTGDIFNRSQPPNWVKQHYYSVIEHLLGHDIAFYIIPGNHDRAVLQPSLIDYSYDNYKVFNQLSTFDHEMVRIIGLPFVYNNHHQAQERIKQLVRQWDGPSIVLAHQVFEGAWFGPQRFRFLNREDAYEMSDLPERSQVISGHIHRSQELQQGRVVYTGSTVRTSFAEVIEPKGYLVGTIDHHRQEIKLEFEELSTMPMLVVEQDSKQIDLEQLDEQLGRLSSPARILIRLLFHPPDYQLIKKIYSRYSLSEYPYLSISPKAPGGVLQPLYQRFSSRFKPVKIHRSWF